MQILDEWLKDIPQQFLGKHNIEVLIKAFARQLQELQQVFDDMKTKLDLDSATGKNLDYVGTIIPLSRKEAGELAGIGTYESEMSDERYRQFLRYMNLVNTNECTYYDLMEGLSLLWDVSPVYYIENPLFPATIILTMPFLKPGGEVVTLGGVPMVKPAGVQIQFQYLIKKAIEIASKYTFQSYSVPLCGQYLCGQWPSRSTLGEMVSTQPDSDVIAIESELIMETAISNVIRCGSSVCGKS